MQHQPRNLFGLLGQPAASSRVVLGA